MDAGPVGTARERLQQAIAHLVDAAGPTATADAVVDGLRAFEEARRALDRAMVEATADLQRRGVFAERGYRSPTGALSDLLGWERFEARRRVIAAENVCAQIGLDGAALAARLPATATVFAAGEAGLRHVEVIARLLDSGPARRLSPETWAGAEVQLAAKAALYPPSELHTWGTQLIELLIHHVHEWQHGGPTTLHNLVMLCAVHHRLIHHSHWEARILDGLPEFIPPSWIDLSRTPRRRPPPLLQPVS